MKKKLLILSLFTSLIAAAQTGHEIDASITSDSVTRTYRLYVPLIYNPVKPVPLIMNFHGLGTTSVQQEAYGDFRKIADTANFIIVHPQGLVQQIGLTGWNNFGAPSQSVPDINFTSNLIDTIKAHYNINMNRIYSTGMSNGGFMSYILACQLSGRFAAIASVSGSMVPSQLNACNTLHPMPLMEIHGTSDSIVEYDGTGGLIACTNIDALINHWVVFNNCNPNPTTITLPDSNTTDSTTAIHYIWDGGTAGSTVEFYKIIGGGHTWPGATTNLGTVSQVGLTNQDFNATKEIWRFFSQQKSFVGIDEQAANETDFNVYPNPTNGIFTIAISNTNSKNLSISVADILGKEVFRLSDINSSAEYKKEINLEHLATGIYNIKLTIGTDIKTRKLIIR